MLELLGRIESDDEVGAVVITGAGEKSFIAGGASAQIATTLLVTDAHNLQVVTQAEGGSPHRRADVLRRLTSMRGRLL